MKIIHKFAPLQNLSLILLTFTLIACEQQDVDSTAPVAETAAVDETASDAVGGGKVGLTVASEEASALYYKGRQLADELRFVEARPYFEQALEKDPGLAMAHVQLAGTSQTAAQFFSSVKSAEALAENVSDGEKLIIQSLAAGANNDQATQQTALEALVAAYPEDERQQFRLGNFYNGQQNYAAAVEQYEAAIANNPEFAGPYNSMGYAQRAAGNYDLAEEAFKNYLALIPNEANPYDSYAELLMEVGRYGESIEQYGKALEVNPEFMNSYSGISINQSLMGDGDSARATLTEFSSKARNNAERRTALFRTATTYLHEENTDAAIAECEKMLAIAEADENGLGMAGDLEYMGDIMLDADDGGRAQEYYDRALALRQAADVNEAVKAQAERTHLFKSAIAAMIRGEMETATAQTSEYRSQAEAGGNSFERRRIHELLGYVALTNEDNETAIAELAQGSQLNPIVLYFSAVAQKNIGNNDEAVSNAEKAANKNTLSGNLPFFRAEALALITELTSD
jgi:tetratricopeptide (TPR) repeat protein